MPQEPVWENVGLKRGRWAAVSLALVLDQAVSAEAVRVFAMLASYADKGGHCYPSMGTVADRLRLDRRTVQRHVRNLEKAGYVQSWSRKRVDGRGGLASNGYLLMYPALLPVSAATPDAASKTGSDATPDAALPNNARHNPSLNTAEALPLATRMAVPSGTPPETTTYPPDTSRKAAGGRR